MRGRGMIPFIVVLEEKSTQAAPAVKERLAAAYRGTYAFTPTAFLVPAGYGTTCSEILAAAGIRKRKDSDSDEPPTGAVFEVSRFSGFCERSLGEWFDNVFRARG